jgi:STE24 endopeptidase
MNIYLIIILIILAGEYLLDLTVERLNIRCASPELPKEFEGYYDAEKYRKSQNYLRDSTNFGLLKSTFFTAIIIIFILAGGFNYIDRIARSFNLNFILTGLIFAGILFLASQILGIPFSAHRIFVIEEKYGFNKTSVKTFVTDILKSWILGAVIGGIVFAGIIWFFYKTGRWAWVYCWVGVTLFQLFLTFIAPVVIMPIFNKFIPLEDGVLKDAIQNYADSQNFKVKGVFKIDASRRSTKSNAFFAGFGKYRRIGLFDTLIQKHTVDELVSVLAHEIGHYKKRHIIKQLVLATINSGLMFFILSFFIKNIGLFAAFRMDETSIYASLLFFSFLYIPISFILSIFANFLSRRYEYEADSFVLYTYKKPEGMILALKKLSVDNLSNLTPHPLKVFLHYSHPPVLQRIQAIREIK